MAPVRPSLSAAPGDAPRPLPRRAAPAGPSARVAALALGLALMLHAMVLGAWPRGGGPRSERSAPVPVQVRALAMAPAPAPAPTPPEPAPVPVVQTTLPRPVPGIAPVAVIEAPPDAPPPAEPLRVDGLPAADTEVAVAADPGASAPGPVPLPEPARTDPVVALVAAEPIADAAPRAALPASATQAAPVAAVPAASGPLPLSDTGEPLPVYATRFAPSQSLSYQLRRGLLGGSAVLDWQRDEPGESGARYRMQLVARAAGFVLLTQDSEGGFDAAGLAPRRFTDQRLQGSTRATNFQRERGRIGFSGPPVEYAWAPGVQDRLSWMVQLPAIVDANPQLAAPGERITLAVVGARGDAAVWVFRFVAEEGVTDGAREVRALKFIREPRKPNDTQAEVWLDPARHHLPVRARLGNPPDGEVLDLRLEVP